MTLDYSTFAIAFLFAPFVLALIAPVISRETGPAAGWILAIVPAGIFFGLSTLIAGTSAGQYIQFGIDWVPALNLRLSFVIDGLSLVFGLAISGVGTFVIIYSGTYLRRHPHRGRFMAFMLLFTGAMLGLVFADSLPALFAFWELTAVTSYLLIGFDHEREVARRAAFQALLVTGLGGLSLMAGGVLLHVLSGTWNISELGGSSSLIGAVWSYPWVVGFIIVAALTKSAQFPFHFWLPNAMEAPTPVSAFLHSAAMVQAGIYLLARFSPLLSGTPIWQGTLCVIGGATLLWGAICALRQTDLKQILAHTTIASLGLMVVLLGFGNNVAALAIAAYFVAHALYKAALFLVAGMIDHGTGTRDITALSGLRDHLTISFICSALAALSMFGLPPFLGWFAKEEVYAGLHTHDLAAVVAIVVLLLGNALLGASALVLGLKPFMGALKPTPGAPHEGGFALWIGPAIFGLCGVAVVFAVSTYGDLILAPFATAIAGHSVQAHLSLTVDPLGPPLWLSVATWAISGLVYWQIDGVRTILATVGRRVTWTFDGGFDHAILGLVRLSAGWSRAFHNGRLEIYVVVLFASLALALWLPMVLLRGWPAMPLFGALQFYEWATIVLAVAGLVVVIMAPTRLVAILALGLQGLALGLIFIFFGAPDLGFTQLLIEVLSVVILAFVMTRLRLTGRDPRPLEDWLRDGALALVCGAGVTLLLLRILQGNFDGRLSEFFTANSVAIAHGRNIVNVILVDYRGLDTLGEISVVLTVGICVLAMLRRQHKRNGPTAPLPPPIQEVAP